MPTRADEVKHAVIGYAARVNTELRTTVLMSVYAGDEASEVDAALASLTGQSLPPDEIVLVEDGPVGPGIGSVIARHETGFPGLRRVPLPENRGLVGALNAGLGECRGEFIFRLDADDVARVDRIAVQLAFMEAHPEIGVCGSTMTEFREDPVQPVSMKPMPETHGEIRARLPWRNPVNHPTVCVRRSLLPDSGYPDLRWVEDYLLWGMLMADGVRFHNLQEPLVAYRFDDETLGRRSGWLNFRNEMAVRLWLRRHGLASFGSVLASGLLQAAIRFSPGFLQRWYWRSVRRSPPVD